MILNRISIKKIQKLNYSITKVFKIIILITYIFKVIDKIAINKIYVKLNIIIKLYRRWIKFEKKILLIYILIEIINKTKEV